MSAQLGGGAGQPEGEKAPMEVGEVEEQKAILVENHFEDTWKRIWGWSGELPIWKELGFPQT